MQEFNTKRGPKVVYNIFKCLSMNLSKVRNSDLISKVLIGIILLTFFSSSSWAQTYPGYPQNIPNTGTALPGYPQQGLPTGQTQGKTIQQTPQDGFRTNDLTEEDTEAMTHEDSVALVMEEREMEDIAVETLRRKIFGYKLFNLQNFDPNAVHNIPTPNNYVLGANDQLIIDIYGYLQEHQEAVINPDGYITLNRAGLIKVSGQTIEDATDNIKRALTKIYPGISNGTMKLKISLGNVRSIKVSVTGEAVAPGTYTMSSLSTVSSALYRSGGPNEIGSFRQIKVIRNNSTVATLDLYDILMKGFSKDDILLKDQDVILIGPFVNRVIVGGGTKRAGYFELLPNETLSDAITYAGGFGTKSYTHRLKIYRNTSKEKEIVDVMNTNYDSFTMTNGDSVFVNEVLERFSNLVSVEGAVYRPGEYSLNSNPTLKALIESSDGLMDDALMGRISIVRTNADLSTENLSVNYKDILTGNSPDLPLRREDRIIVPSIFDLTEVAFVRIQGAINNEDAEEGVELPYAKNLTLEDVIVRVGGLTEAASLSRIEIVRRKRNVDITKVNAQISDIIRLDVTPDLEVVSGKENITLQPFDEIFVRSSPNYEEQTYVKIEGEVFYPSTYGIASKDEKISDLIKRAGGLTLQAYSPGATLVRTVQLSELELEQKRKTLEALNTGGTDTQVIEIDEVEETREEAIDIDLAAILKNPGAVGDLTLQDGDLIKVPKLLETIRIQGEVLYPTTVKFMKGSAFKNYISGAGGFTKRSMRRKSYVLYPNGSVDRTRKFLVFNIYPKIEPGSEIIVPQKVQNNADQLASFANVLGTLSATLGTIFSIYGFISLGK